MSVNQMDNDKISIVVPIYNMKKLVGRCIESVLRQTYDCFELILVDDGSRDGSLAICRDYEAKDGRIRVIAKENGGVSTARNAGLEVADGKWIMFIDPDDFIKDDIIDKLLAITDEDTDIVCCCCAKENEPEGKVSFFDGNVVFTDAKKPLKALKQGWRYESKRLLYLELIDRIYKAGPEGRVTAIGVPWGKLYRRSFLQESKIIFDPLLKRMQDNVFNMFVFEKARTIRYIDDPLYIYNVDHLNNISVKYDDKIKQYYGRLLEVRYDFCKSRGMLEDREIELERCSEIGLFSNMMLIKYFLHIQYPGTRRQRKEEIRRFFGQELYQTAFSKKNLPNLPGSNWLRIWLIQHHQLEVLILMEQTFRKLRHEY